VFMAGNKYVGVAGDVARKTEVCIPALSSDFDEDVILCVIDA